MENSALQNKISELKLDWFVKDSTLLAYDFNLLNINKTQGFVNDLLNLFVDNKYHVDILIHKHAHVRIEIYDKAVGGFDEFHVDLAKQIEDIYIEKYQENG